MTWLWTAQAAAAATGGQVQGDWAGVTGFDIDSRQIGQGEMFVALTAARDGHDFVGAALDNGAGAALVSRVPAGMEKAPLLVVQDVQSALEALGIAGRARTPASVIGVTGSVGKTGTKDMLRLMLADQGATHAAIRSFNNHWGVPLTLARMPEHTEYAVVEIGMNHPGEITPLSGFARPDVAIITTVAAVHIEAFADGIDGIARAKAEIFAGLKPGGLAVLNADIPTLPILRAAAEAAGAQVVLFGRSGTADIRLLDMRPDAQGLTAQCSFFGDALQFRIGAPGDHLAMNALAALAAIRHVGGDVAKAAAALCEYAPTAGRGAQAELKIGQKTITLIDESYNANPTSMEAALNVLAGTETTGRKIAFIGDMRELGDGSVDYHAGIAGLEAIAAMDQVHCIGPFMRHAHDALPAQKRGLWSNSANDMLDHLSGLIEDGDHVMIKASLGTGLGVLVQALKDEANG